jgi:hypothetical protein
MQSIIRTVSDSRGNLLAFLISDRVLIEDLGGRTC